MLSINKSIMTERQCYLNQNNPKYIVVHYTGCVAPAVNFALSQKNNTLNGTAHMFVDDTTIYQSIEIKHGTWSVGDDEGHGRFPYGITNLNSINVEVCIDSTFKVTAKTEQNTLELVQYLMKQYNIDINHVVRHYDASYKICPNWSDNNWARWTSFKAKLSSMVQGSAQTTASTSSSQSETILSQYAENGVFTCTVDKIYFRNSPSVASNNPTVGNYVNGEKVTYDKVVITNKYIYISWISASAGVRRYMPITDKTTGQKWGTCS